MKNVKRHVGFLIGSLFVASAAATVRVYVQEDNGLASVQYECTEGEVIRAFALDVTVDKGKITGISDFFRGPSTAVAQGYGIFPASFRDHIATGTDINWGVSGYTPLAVTADNPRDTLPGLNSSGVTLELGALWDPNAPLAVPPSAGTLCSLRLSERAKVSITANTSRGGVVAADPDIVLAPVFAGAVVQPPAITSLSLTNGLLTITFAGGTLETASSIVGPWTPIENTSGQYTNSVGDDAIRFYRVRGR